MLRVVQMGLGPIGAAIARRLVGRAEFALVAAVDPRPGVAGRDVGELIGVDPLGLEVGTSLEAALDSTRPTLIVNATGSHLLQVAAQIRPALSRGVSVVSTCEELSYPFYRHPDLARDLDAQARDAGAVLLGTGVNPGFVMDKLVVTLMAACMTVRSVRVRRVLDAARRREPFQRKIGAGLTPGQFEARVASGLGHVGLAESAHMLADAMGVGPERELVESLSPVLADRRVASDHVAVETGQVLGIDQKLALRAGGRDQVRLELEMYLGAPHSQDSVTIDGSPPLEMIVSTGVPGDEGTANVVVRCARLLPHLAPGLRTMLDVPLR